MDTAKCKFSTLVGVPPQVLRLRFVGLCVGPLGFKLLRKRVSVGLYFFVGKEVWKERENLFVDGNQYWMTRRCVTRVLPLELCPEDGTPESGYSGRTATTRVKCLSLHLCVCPSRRIVPRPAWNLEPSD